MMIVKTVVGGEPETISIEDPDGTTLSLQAGPDGCQAVTMTGPDGGECRITLGPEVVMALRIYLEPDFIIPL